MSVESSSEFKLYPNRGSEQDEALQDDCHVVQETRECQSEGDRGDGDVLMKEMFSVEFSKLAEWKKKLLESIEKSESDLKEELRREAEVTAEVSGLLLKFQEAESEGMRYTVQIRHLERQLEADMETVKALLGKISKSNVELESLTAQSLLKSQTIANLNSMIEGSVIKEKEWKNRLDEKLADIEIENRKLRQQLATAEEVQRGRHESDLEEVKKFEDAVRKRVDLLETKIKRMPERVLQERIEKNRLMAKLKQAKLKLNR